ncbi:MAG TPA: alpha/beta hydrolase-fold protein [Roseiflexaceae bacterium]|nr:alpha/beta hydrolase-fold protein [Roseiflexaceae bacterium]
MARGAHTRPVAAPPFDGADARDWTVSRRGVPAGRVDTQRLRSAILGNERRVWAYTPPGYTPGNPCELLIMFDGWTYSQAIPTPVILNNLLASGRIAPTAALLIDSLDEPTRDRELACYPPFVAFLAEELLPWAHERFQIAGPAIVGGSSYGGLAAAFAAHERPDLFGKVLAQSGSFWWKPDADPEHEWLARQYAETPLLPLQFYLSVGRREARARLRPNQLIVSRHLRDVLRAKGYPVHYRETDGRHDNQSWRETLADGILALAGLSYEF